MNDNTPLRLEDAAEALRERFPLTVSMLRTEIRKGRLVPAKVAGKFFVTPAQIAELFTPCPAAPKVPASILRSEPAVKPSGSSETVSMSAPQAALTLALEKLRGSSPPTSRRSGRQSRAPASAAVVTPLRSASSKS